MSVTLRCPKCGHEIDWENPVCAGCGAKLKVKPLKLPETPAVRIPKKTLDENETRLDARPEKVRGAGELVGEEGAAVAVEAQPAVAAQPHTGEEKVRPGILPYLFVSGTWDKWLFRGGAVLMALWFLVPIFSFSSLTLRFEVGWWRILGWFLVGLLPIAFLALSFAKRSAIWMTWGVEVLVCIGMIISLTYRLRNDWPIMPTLVGICLVVVLAISHACTQKWFHAIAWLIYLGFFAASENIIPACILGVLTLLFISCMRRKPEWLGRLDALDRKLDWVYASGGEWKFFKFFSVFCWCALAFSLVAALIFFFAETEIGTGWYSRTVRLYKMVPLFSGDAWNYWNWVVGWCSWIAVAAIYSASVARMTKCHMDHLEAWAPVAVERNIGLHVWGTICKGTGLLVAVASLVMLFTQLSEGEEVPAMVYLAYLVFGGIAAVCGWGWGSIFCTQAWNEGAAERILRGFPSEDGDSGLNTRTQLLPSILDAYRSLAIELGADTAGSGDLERGDAEAKAAPRMCRDAAASYRNACEKGALAKAAAFAEESRRAYGQRQWKEAFLLAEKALDFAPSDPGMVRLRMQTWWRKNRLSVILVGVLLLAVLVVRLVIGRHP